MANELLEKCKNLKINDAETQVFEVGELEDGIDKDQVSLVLVGRLVTERSFNIEAFKRTMIRVWAVTKRLIIRMIGPDLFVFQFFHWRNKDKVMEGRPWCFENQLLILNEFNGEDPPADVPITHSPFWIRLKNLLFNYRSSAICRAIASKIEYVMELEDDDLNLENYRRVRVMMDVAQPLCRFQDIQGKDGRVFRISIGYERVPFFCFLCGTIGHSENECVNVDDDEPVQCMGWGKHLRTTPKRGAKKLVEEVEEVKSCRKNLFVAKPRNTKVKDKGGVAIRGGGDACHGMAEVGGDLWGEKKEVVGDNRPRQKGEGNKEIGSTEIVIDQQGSGPRLLETSFDKVEEGGEKEVGHNGGTDRIASGIINIIREESGAINEAQGL